MMKLVVGNWKMHGCRADNAALLAALVAGAATLPAAARLAVCVPFPYLAQAQQVLDGSAVQWGVQDVSAHARGAFTGEVAAAMVMDFGARFAIAGHSERRAYHGESSALVAAKAQAALAHGLTPIVCVGETLDQRNAGATHAVVGAQLQAVLDLLPPDDVARIVLAYEPVWAIGTGKSATVAEAQAVHAMLRAQLSGTAAILAKVPLLYGGSVKAANARELFAAPDIDGGLIGGASLDADEFLAIGAAC